MSDGCLTLLGEGGGQKLKMGKFSHVLRAGGERVSKLFKNFPEIKKYFEVE